MENFYDVVDVSVVENVIAKVALQDMPWVSGRVHVGFPSLPTALIPGTLFSSRSRHELASVMQEPFVPNFAHVLMEANFVVFLVREVEPGLLCKV